MEKLEKYKRGKKMKRYTIRVYRLQVRYIQYYPVARIVDSDRVSISQESALVSHLAELYG